MENLVRLADQALVLLDEFVQKDIWIKHAPKFVGCLESIKSTSKQACFGESRCWGRTDLTQAVTRLEELFGCGCELEEEPVAVKKEERFGIQVMKPVFTGAPLRKRQEGILTVDPNERPYSINDLIVLHNLSSKTVIRLYENEPGVQILQGSREHQQKLGRRYRTIRVPRHVYMRVKHRLENR